MAVKLRANLIGSGGRTVHYLGRFEDGKPVPTAQLPPASRVEINEEEGSYYLIRYDSSGDFSGDTWHQSIEEAQRQAEAEFGITSVSWEQVAD